MENEDGRYLLISAKSCPYAHRLEIVRNLNKLQEVVQIIYCDPIFSFESGWILNHLGCQRLFELYNKDGNFTGRATLPVLYDLKLQKIINNESAEIIQLFNSISKTISDDMKDQIDEFYKVFNDCICVGTYKAGHAKSVDEYRKYFNLVFDYLDQLDNRCAGSKYLFGDNITIADIYAYPHLIRFDPIFYCLFSLNKKHLWEYPNIARYLNDVSAISEFRNTVDLDEMKRGAFMSENNLPQNLGYVKIPFGNGGLEKYFDANI